MSVPKPVLPLTDLKMSQILGRFCMSHEKLEFFGFHIMVREKNIFLVKFVVKAVGYYVAFAS